jgi:hypothetical protein
MPQLLNETECKKCFTLYFPHAPKSIGKIEVDTAANACLKIFSFAALP